MVKVFRKLFSFLTLLTGALLAAVIVLDVVGVWSFVDEIVRLPWLAIVGYVVCGLFVVSAVATLVLAFIREQQTSLEPVNVQSSSAPDVLPAPEYAIRTDETQEVEQVPAEPAVEAVAAVEKATPEAMVDQLDPDLADIEYTGTRQDDELDLDSEFVVDDADSAPVKQSARTKITSTLEEASTQANDDVSKILEKINAIIDLVKDGDK